MGTAYIGHKVLMYNAEEPRIVAYIKCLRELDGELKQTTDKQRQKELEAECEKCHSAYYKNVGQCPTKKVKAYLTGN